MSEAFEKADAAGFGGGKRESVVADFNPPYSTVCRYVLE